MDTIAKEAYDEYKKIVPYQPEWVDLQDNTKRAWVAAMQPMCKKLTRAIELRNSANAVAEMRRLELEKSNYTSKDEEFGATPTNQTCRICGAQVLEARGGTVCTNGHGGDIVA